MPSVTLRLLTDDLSPGPIFGVAIEIYDTDGEFQTSGTTDAEGEVTVSLPEATYDILFYKAGISILPKQPQRIEVLEEGNEFEVTAHVRALPQSSDPLRCTVSGYILGANGIRTRTKMIFKPKKELLVLSGNVIAPELQVDASSDEQGYFEFELLRGIEYKAYFVYLDTLLGVTPGALTVIVPASAAIDLDKLLFPLPVNLTFSETAISLVAGAEPDESIGYTLLHTDGSSRTGGTPWASISLTNSDNTVVEAALRDNLLCLTPLSAGTATITTVRTVKSTVTILPLPDYETETVTVTVTG